MPGLLLFVLHLLPPDGPKHKGRKRDSKRIRELNRRRREARDNFRNTISPKTMSYEVRDGKYYFEGKEVSKNPIQEAHGAHPTTQHGEESSKTASQPVTKKQGKKAQGPMIPISAPMPVKETVAAPRQVMQQAADSIREQNAILAKQREQVIRKNRTLKEMPS